MVKKSNFKARYDGPANADLNEIKKNNKNVNNENIKNNMNSTKKQEKLVNQRNDMDDILEKMDKLNLKNNDGHQEKLQIKVQAQSKSPWATDGSENYFPTTSSSYGAYYYNKKKIKRFLYIYISN